MTATVTPMERPRLPEHITNTPEERERVQALSAKMGRISRVLSANAALPTMRGQAKDDLVKLASEALDLWGIL